MKLLATPDCATARRVRRAWLAETPFSVPGGHLEVIRRTIVRSIAVLRGQSCDSTFIYLPNSLFFNWNCLCAHCNAKSLFDNRKPVDRGFGGTYSGAEWQKVGQSGLDFGGNRRSEAAKVVAGD
jgi:hypothetical protein